MLCGELFLWNRIRDLDCFFENNVASVLKSCMISFFYNFFGSKQASPKDLNPECKSKETLREVLFCLICEPGHMRYKTENFAFVFSVQSTDEPTLATPTTTIQPNSGNNIQKYFCLIGTLQMFAGVYRVFTGKSECGDFKFTGIACIPAIPVIFEVNQKKCGLFIYTLY